MLKPKGMRDQCAVPELQELSEQHPILSPEYECVPLAPGSLVLVPDPIQLASRPVPVGCDDLIRKLEAQKLLAQQQVERQRLHEAAGFLLQAQPPFARDMKTGPFCDPASSVLQSYCDVPALLFDLRRPHPGEPVFEKGQPHVLGQCPHGYTTMLTVMTVTTD
jgi:hypothetical protein